MSVIEPLRLTMNMPKMRVQLAADVQAEMTPKIPPFKIERLVQPYLPPDNAVRATKRITEDLALMFHHQMTYPYREKWSDYDRVVVPVLEKPGRYRLYGRGFYKDEGIEISWTPAQEQELAQMLGYGDRPLWNDMPTSLSRVLYPPGRLTEEQLRPIREERERQNQDGEARAIWATAIGEVPSLRTLQPTDRPANNPRPRSVKITGLGKKQNQDDEARAIQSTATGERPTSRATQSADTPANSPRPRGVKITGLGKEQRQRVKETASKGPGEHRASYRFDDDSERASESSEEYAPTEGTSDGEWEEHDGRKRSRVIRSRTEKQEEPGKPKTRSAPTTAKPALPKQPNPPLVLDDGSCAKCETSTGGAMVRCDTKHEDNVWYHVECTGLDEIPSLDESWFCDDCQKRDRKPEQLGNSGVNQAKRRKGRNFSTRRSNTRQHQWAKDKRGKSRVNKREKIA